MFNRKSQKAARDSIEAVEKRLAELKQAAAAASAPLGAAEKAAAFYHMMVARQKAHDRKLVFGWEAFTALLIRHGILPAGTKIDSKQIAFVKNMLNGMLKKSFRPIGLPEYKDKGFPAVTVLTLLNQHGLAGLLSFETALYCGLDGVAAVKRSLAEFGVDLGSVIGQKLFARLADIDVLLRTDDGRVVLESMLCQYNDGTRALGRFCFEKKIGTADLQNDPLTLCQIGIDAKSGAVNFSQILVVPRAATYNLQAQAGSAPPAAVLAPLLQNDYDNNFPADRSILFGPAPRPPRAPNVPLAAQAARSDSLDPANAGGPCGASGGLSSPVRTQQKTLAAVWQQHKRMLSPGAAVNTTQAGPKRAPDPQAWPDRSGSPPAPDDGEGEWQTVLGGKHRQLMPPEADHTNHQDGSSMGMGMEDDDEELPSWDDTHDMKEQQALAGKPLDMGQLFALLTKMSCSDADIVWAMGQANKSGDYSIDTAMAGEYTSALVHTPHSR
mmetsp:Transcript_68049/g.188348  ORF Transcript_68049/g.188348 Transcript_68049/m.188348 type:complete len:496 (+) Transcript_68049:3630-5117(+)